MPYVGTSATGDDLHVIDVSNPASISEVDSVDLSVAVRGLELVGEMLYVTSLTAGQDLHVVDVSNPVSVSLIGGVDLGSGNAFDVVVVGKYAYVGTAAGINVVDISGARLQSVLTSSFQAGRMFVSGNSDMGGNLAVRGSLYSAADIQSTGVLRVHSTEASYIAGGFSVGTTSSSTGLTVDGAILSTDLLGGATNLTTDVNGNIIRDPSDARLKQNVATLDDALDKMLALRGVSYTWRDAERFGTQTEIGFIAQEVDLVLPEVVRKGGDYWSLNTRNILAVVVEAFKDMWDVVQGNEERIEELEARITELEIEEADTQETQENVDDDGTQEDDESDSVNETDEEEDDGSDDEIVEDDSTENDDTATTSPDVVTDESTEGEETGAATTTPEVHTEEVEQSAEAEQEGEQEEEAESIDEVMEEVAPEDAELPEEEPVEDTEIDDAEIEDTEIEEEENVELEPDIEV